MKELKQGDCAIALCRIDACRTGYMKKEYRISIGGKKIWVDASCLAVAGGEKNEEHAC